MGRRRKYYTEEQIREANCKKSSKYYNLNKEIIKGKRVKNYYEGKIKELTEVSGSIINNINKIGGINNTKGHELRENTGSLGTEGVNTSNSGSNSSIFTEQLIREMERDGGNSISNNI